MKKIILFFTFCLLAVSVIAVYILYDNSRIVVRRQAVEIENLDPAFDGFTIVQMSDLHSTRFGKNQARLVKLLDSLPYDMIAINGDMVDRQTENPLPFLEFLDNLNKKDIVFYVTGNVGPKDLRPWNGTKTEYGQQLAEHGGILLDKPHIIERNGAQIWIMDYAHQINTIDAWIKNLNWQIGKEKNPQRKSELQVDLQYQMELHEIVKRLTRDDVLIGLTHYPLTPDALDNPHADDLPVYDLLLAGHYHGGQIRIPFVGAVYLPQPSPDRLFPPEEIVSGFYQGKQTQQYISRGLGASSTIPFLNFRLFNPPEITLITLKPKIN